MLGILQYIFSNERVCKLAMGGHRRSSSHVQGFRSNGPEMPDFPLVLMAEPPHSCICCHQLIQPERRIPAAKRPGHHSCNLHAKYSHENWRGVTNFGSNRTNTECYNKVSKMRSQNPPPMKLI